MQRWEETSKTIIEIDIGGKVSLSMLNSVIPAALIILYNF